jgi:hypothetical protein
MYISNNYLYRLSAVICVSWGVVATAVETGNTAFGAANAAPNSVFSTDHMSRIKVVDTKRLPFERRTYKITATVLTMPLEKGFTTAFTSKIYNLFLNLTNGRTMLQSQHFTSEFTISCIDWRILRCALL